VTYGSTKVASVETRNPKSEIRDKSK